MNLALFDFDGTITFEDTFTSFVLSSTPTYRKRIGQVLLLPFIIGYKIRLISPSFMRRLVLKLAFKGLDKRMIDAYGIMHATHFLPQVIRDEALEKLQWHQANGDYIVVVSASLDVYLSQWCKSMNIQLLCNTLEEVQGKLTGRLAQPDCCGVEKVKRIKHFLSLHSFDHIYAYGDTAEDLAMLKLADSQYYQWRKIN